MRYQSPAAPAITAVLLAAAVAYALAVVLYHVVPFIVWCFEPVWVTVCHHITLC